MLKRSFIAGILSLTVIAFADDLLKNGGFEVLNRKGDFPVFWGGACYSGGAGEISLEKMNIDSGKYAIRLLQTSQKGYLGCNQTIMLKEPLKTSREVTISLRASANQLKHGYVALYAGTRKKPQLQWCSLFSWRGTFEWKTFQKSVKLTPGAEQITISIRTSGPGILWADTVSIKMQEAIPEVGTELVHNGQLEGKISPVSGLVPNWSMKMYPGLEAEGNIGVSKDGYAGCSALTLQWIGGARRFGAEVGLKPFAANSSVFEAAAMVKTARNGSAVMAVEMFDSEGNMIGELFSSPLSSTGWQPLKFEFATVPNAASIRLYCLSNDVGEVCFSMVSCKRLSARPASVALPLEAQILPVDWSTVWKKGKKEFTSFAEAPLPVGFHLKGEKNRLKCPEIVIELPEALTIADAYNMHVAVHRRETAVKEKVTRPEGNFVRYRFVNPGIFRILQTSYGWSRVLCVVITPAEPGLVTGAFPVYWHLADGAKRTPEQSFTFRLAKMPEKGKQQSDFRIFRWDADDLLYTDNALLEKAMTVFERSGLTIAYRYGKKFKRGMEINAMREKRGWIHANGLHDHSQPGHINAEFLEPIKNKLEYRVHTVYGFNKGKFCPDYFTDDQEFGRIFKEFLRFTIASMAMRPGEMIVMDHEPWNTLEWCYCDRSRKKFAQYIDLDHVPDIAEIKKKYVYEWSRFRCENTAKMTKMYRDVVSRHFPGLKLADYDYAVDFSHSDYRTAYYRVAKDPELNEQFFDAHLSSYYHIIDKAAFNMIRINSRKLKKDYIPNCAIDGPGTFLTASEILSPAQARQMMLAGAVHGSPGFAIYRGVYLDGEYHLAFSRAMREIAAMQDYFRNGKLDAPEVKAFVRPFKTQELKTGDKTQIIGLPHRDVHFAYTAIPLNRDRLAALFNYHPEHPMYVDIRADLPEGNYSVIFPVSERRLQVAADRVSWNSEELKKGILVEVKPNDVAFVLIRPFKEGEATGKIGSVQTEMEMLFRKAAAEFRDGSLLKERNAGTLSVRLSDINNDGVPEVELSSAVQKLWIDYMGGGSVCSWNVCGQMSEKTTFALDKIWLPKKSRRDLTDAATIKDIKIDETHIALTLEKKIPAMELTIDKTYRIAKDETGFTIDYRFVNTGTKAVTFSFWGTNLFSGEKPVFSNCINERLQKIPSMDGGDFVYGIGKKKIAGFETSSIRGILSDAETFAEWNGIRFSLKCNGDFMANYYYYITPMIHTWEWMGKSMTLAPGEHRDCSIQYSAGKTK